MHQREFIGAGSISSLPALIAEFNARSVFLLHGRSSFRSSGLDRRLETLLPSTRVTRWSDFNPNPIIDDLAGGLKALRGAGGDCLVSIGGGSVMDMAKLLKFYAETQESPADLLRRGANPDRMGSIPHIAIPTTSGSGSEATHFAVVYCDGVKHSIADERLLPEAAIVDAELTYLLPARQTAVSGMDALCQAIESYWSVHSTEESRQLAADALALIRDHLPSAVRSPGPGNRSAMSVAAHLAGKAINITKTTAPHAISYTLTMRFGIPHGHAVALTLGELLVYNSRVTADDATDPRGPGFVRERIADLQRSLGCDSPEATREWLWTLMGRIGLETRLDALGVRTSADRDAVVDGVNIQRLANNPRTLTRDGLQAIIERLCGLPAGGRR